MSREDELREKLKAIQLPNDYNGEVLHLTVALAYYPSAGISDDCVLSTPSFDDIKLYLNDIENRYIDVDDGLYIDYWHHVLIEYYSIERHEWVSVEVF